MSLSPIGGIPSVTRSGDLDPEVVLRLVDDLGGSTVAVRDVVSQHAGVVGVAGRRLDTPSLLAATDPEADLAARVFTRGIAMAVAAAATAPAPSPMIRNCTNDCTVTGLRGDSRLAERRAGCRWIPRPTFHLFSRSPVQHVPLAAPKMVPQRTWSKLIFAFSTKLPLPTGDLALGSQS